MGSLKEISKKTKDLSLEKIIKLNHFFLVRKIRRNTCSLFEVGFKILTLKLRSVWQRLQLLCGAGHHLIAHLQGKLPGHLYWGCKGES